MTRIAALIGIAVLAVALYFVLTRRSSAPSEPPVATASGSAAATTGSNGDPAQPRGRVDRVGRVSREERAQLAERIADARRRRASGGSSGSTGTAPNLAGSNAEADAQLVRTTMKEAMREVIPFLAECYDQHLSKLPAQIEIVADITLTGDPDVGTLIDTHGLADKTGAAIEPAFDLCMRDALATLQMPPLSEGGEVKVTYPFMFANEPDGSGGSDTLPQ